MKELKIVTVECVQSCLTKWTHYKIELPKEPTSPLQCWGFDPGTRHIGVAVIPFINETNYADLYQIETPRWSDAVERIVRWQSILGELRLVIQGRSRMVIEGAAFGENYRQVELAEIRASTVLWARRLGIDIRIVAPATIRKCVFGSGKIRAHEIWQLPDAPDAVAALSCAYYASDCWKM